MKKCVAALPPGALHQEILKKKRKSALLLRQDKVCQN
jgi:hypothetical protein